MKVSLLRSVDKTLPEVKINQVYEDTYSISRI